jgi:hypothetical protein
VQIIGHLEPIISKGIVIISDSTFICGPGSSVGIATGYGLEGPGIESTWTTRLSAPVQTGPVAHSVSCRMGTWSFLGVKNDRSATLTPHSLPVPWS